MVSKFTTESISVIICFNCNSNFSLSDAEPQSGSVNPINGLKTISKVVGDARNYLKNTNPKNILGSKNVPFNCALAPSLGNLTEKTFKDMDRNVQVNNFSEFL